MVLISIEMLIGLLESFRVAEDMPIESDLVNQALDRIQIQIEEYYRGIRLQVSMAPCNEFFD